MGIVLPLAVLGIGIYGTYVGLSTVRRAIDINNGKWIDAAELASNSTFGGKDETITLGFQVNGKSYAVQKIVPQTQGSNVSANQTYKVKYNPADPSEADADPEQRLSLGWKWLGAGVFELLIGGWFVLAGLRQRKELLEAAKKKGKKI
jgi:hypothetical protein